MSHQRGHVEVRSVRLRRPALRVRERQYLG
jgi:hypothetical protein